MYPMLPKSSNYYCFYSLLLVCHFHLIITITSNRILVFGWLFLLRSVVVVFVFVLLMLATTTAVVVVVSMIMMMLLFLLLLLSTLSFLLAFTFNGTHAKIVFRFWFVTSAFNRLNNPSLCAFYVFNNSLRCISVCKMMNNNRIYGIISENKWNRKCLD